MGRILVVDDILEELDSLAAIFIGPDERTIHKAQSIDQALQLIQEEALYDVVVNDMRMSDQEEDERGLIIVEAARKRDPLTEIIVRTAFTKPENVRKALRRGANQYFDK